MSLSNTLADQKTSKMATATPKNAAWMKTYMEALINPFSTILKSPKIYDGEIKHTAGLKLRATGEIVCSATGPTNIIVFPGLTNVICYCTEPTGDDDYVGAVPDAADPRLDPIIIDGTIFKQHLSTAADRSVVRLARLTGAGARFFLTNSAEEDDGYWEACRITSHASERDVVLKNDTSVVPQLGAAVLKTLNPDFTLVNSPSYQFGQLRDIHKFIFKLNSEDNDHKFSSVASLNANYTDTSLNTALADLDQWDMIFIKIRGRRNATSPSVLRFDTVANQEIVYTENSQLARMMDESPRDSNIDGFLEYSRIDLPAFQALS